MCLQPLVGEVDAELLERVHPELLEAEDVEHADERARLGSVSSDSLIRATSQSNMREYSAFASESRANA